MGKTRIEKFAKDNLGITLNAAQIEMLKYASEGKTVIRARAIGLSTARTVAQAWLKHGLENAPTNLNGKD